MEEEVVWEIGEIVALRGGESPPLFDEPSPPLFEEPTPPLFDEPTPPPHVYLPTSVSSLTRGDAAAAAASSISNKRRRFAASSKAIQGLREVTAPPTDGSDDCCAICLQDLGFRPDPAETPDLRLRAMPCSHTFHEHCIFEWLRRNAVCPLCRHQLPTEDAHEQEQEQGRRRSRSRIAYNDADGQYYMVWHYMDHPLAIEEDPEQERTRTAALREFYNHWRNMVASGRSATAPAEDQSIIPQS